MDTTLFEKHITWSEIEAGINSVLGSPKDVGLLKLLVQRPAVNKRNVIGKGVLDTSEGLAGDNWLTRGSRWSSNGDPERQITVMNWRFALLVATDKRRIPLAGDQLYVDLDLGKENLPAGTRLSIGKAVIEVTAPPHLGCRKFVERFGLDAMIFANSEFGRLHNLRGINAKVVEGGEVSAGDDVLKKH